MDHDVPPMPDSTAAWLSQDEIPSDDLHTSPLLREDLAEFIIGAASLGFIPPVDLASAPLYRRMQVGPVFPQSGPAFQPPLRGDLTGVGVLRMNIPSIASWELAAVTTLPVNDRKNIVMFCHELLHYLHFLDNRVQYVAMKASIAGGQDDFSCLEEMYTVDLTAIYRTQPFKA